MTGASASGIALAAAAGTLFEAGYLLQALEARRAPAVAAPTAGLLATLARRPRWLAGIAASVGAFALQVLALRHAPLSVVQPVLAVGLVGLLAASGPVLGQAVGRREATAAAGIVAGVGLLAAAGPARTGGAATTGLAIAAIVLGLVLVAPFARRSAAVFPLVVGAAAGDALAALAVNEVARALTDRPPAAAAWAALAATAGVLALAAESTALQRAPAATVAPGVLAGQVAVPVLLAPLVAGETWSQTAGGGLLVLAGLLVLVASILVLARSPAVAGVRGGTG